MKLKFFTAIALCAMAIMACDEDTATIGGTLTSSSDQLEMTTHNFNVLTQSVAVDSVYSRERQCYLGRVNDPETNTNVESQFTTQFFLMENIVNELPKKDSILSRDNGLIAADSCVIQIYFDVKTSYGDTLTAMKLKMSELSEPIMGDDVHYTNFDPRKNGYIRQDGLVINKMFTLRDLMLSDSIRNVINTGLTATSGATYSDLMKIRLNDPYTDKNGVTYNNYGSFILRNVYDHPEYFKNTYTFLNNICPGFQFEITDGLGVMAHIIQMDMFVYYHYTSGGSIKYTMLRTTSTEEVVQTSKVTNDRAALARLIQAESDCTYLKTPSGVFTEVTLPVDEICSTHAGDSLLSAKVSFNRQNNKLSTAADLAFNVPSKLLLLQKDSLTNFFEGNKLANNIYSFRSNLSANAYTFSNLSNLINYMNTAKKKGLESDPDWLSKHPDWNKCLLVPIEEVTVSQSSSSTSTVSLKNNMGLSSTRLVRGTAANPITIEVIYAKFKD